MIRLQGREFHKVKEEFKTVSWNISSNGRIRINLTPKNSKSNKATHYHWLNNEEIVEFLRSDYYKKTPASVIEPKQKRKKAKKTEINDYSQDTLDLMQLYSHLGVEAYGEDIQEQALKEIARLQKVEIMNKTYYKKLYSCYCCPICGKLVCKFYGSPKSIKRMINKLTRNKLKQELIKIKELEKENEKM